MTLQIKWEGGGAYEAVGGKIGGRSKIPTQKRLPQGATQLHKRSNFGDDMQIMNRCLLPSNFYEASMAGSVASFLDGQMGS
jgi:hypothetical protein